MLNKQLTNDEFILISRDLEEYHAIFSKIWNLGKPVFTDKIPTAAVSFDKEGNFFDFQFNYNFWNSLKPYERNFVICHECVHVLLNHGIRLKEFNKEIGNISADVVVNEMLVKGFGFDKNKLDWIKKNGCWLDTVFDRKKHLVEEEKSVEYYYNLLKDRLNNGDFNTLKTVDDHGSIEKIYGSGIEEILNDILNNFNEEEKDTLWRSLDGGNSGETKECSKMAGSLPGNLQIKVNIGNVKYKRKWESVIKHWSSFYIKEDSRDYEQWARINRRFVGVYDKLFLPSEMEIDEREEVKNKIKVIFFQDTSGSCSRLATRFFRAAKSLPKDRFDVELYCFDTRVYKVDINKKTLYGFGGTSFGILEGKVLQICNKDLTKYPKAIFVITDGRGNRINPSFPNRWYWFLTGNNRTYIPKTSNVYSLRDFE